MTEREGRHIRRLLELAEKETGPRPSFEPRIPRERKRTVRQAKVTAPKFEPKPPEKTIIYIDSEGMGHDGPYVFNPIAPLPKGTKKT